MHLYQFFMVFSFTRLAAIAAFRDTIIRRNGREGMTFSSKLSCSVICGKVSHKATNDRGREYDYSNHDYHSLYVRKCMLMYLIQSKFT